jgi:hypothetical protein
MMGKTISEWKTIISKLSTKDLNKYYNNLSQLNEWKEFITEYEWTGLNQIKQLLKYELDKRN